MKKAGLLLVPGFLLLVFGLFWLGTIYKRCEKIYPTIVPKASAPKTTEVSSPTPSVEASKEEKEPPVKKVRSPYAKDHFFYLFWALVFCETVCALSYLTTGYGLIVRLATARIIGLMAIALDIFFKVFTIGYMLFCATPLAKITENENVLTSYFYADPGIFTRFSGWVSGLMFFQKHSLWDVLSYLVFIGILFLYLRQDALRQALLRK